MTTLTAPVKDNDAEPLRRHFVAIATSTYDDTATYAPLPVAEEVDRLAQWLTDDVVLGPRRFTPAFPRLRDNPSKAEIRDALEEPGPGWRSADAAVIYITGHGEKDDDNTHWTVLKKTTHAELVRTALRTRDLLDWLRTTDPVGHLFFIVDSCHAGAVIPATGQQRSDFPSTWFVLTSTTEDHTADSLALARAVTAVMDDLAAPEGGELGKEHHSHLSVADFLSRLRRHLTDAQFRYVYVGDLTADHYCLPNPHYRRPSVVDTATQRRDLAIPVRDLRVHWQPRAFGYGDADHADRTADGRGQRWLFTGRAHLMRELIAIARGERDDKALVTVVAGGAGCGKSAVLARLVTLSDPTFVERYAEEVAAIPDDLKPALAQGVDVAVVATSKYPEDILRQLADDLDVPIPSAEPGVPEREHTLKALITTLDARDEPVTVVLDALDESRDPNGIIQVLARLAASGRLRLLVGVRSPARPDDPLAAVTAQGSLADRAETALNARRLQVDADPWWHQDDIRRYADSILRHTPNSPYSDPEYHDQAAALASVICDRVGRTFLVTRLAAEALAARQDRVDPADVVWRATLDDGVVGVFRADLAQTYDDPARRLRALHLLRAAAFAYGRGVPWRDGIWAAMANAVADLPHEYGSGDIADLLSSRMGAYLVTDVEDDITVYRLFHDALRGTLRDQWQELLDES